MPGKCLRCGACCRSLIIEASWIDVEREPRIKAECPELSDPDGTVWSVAVGHTQPCPFLVENDRRQGGFRCSIYPTRPNECVAFEAGGEKCHEVRRDAGLEPDEKETNHENCASEMA